MLKRRAFGAHRSGTGPLFSPATLAEHILKSSPDVVVVANADGEIVYISGQCRMLLGYAPDDLLGKNVDTLLPLEYRHHQAHRQHYMENPTSRLMGNHAILTIRHKDGNTIPVDIALSPLPHTEGEERLVQAVIRDARLRWEAQQLLLLQSVAMNAAANGIVITNTQGVIEWVNNAASMMTGYSYEELVGRHTRILKSGQHPPLFYEQIWQTVTAGKTWYGQIINRRKDGTYYYEEQHITPVFAEDQRTITHFIAIKQDVTIRKQTEEALRRANHELAERMLQIERLNDRLREQAIRDPLTHLYNRRYLIESIHRDTKRAERSGQPLAIIALDVDRFKHINDTFGHAVGDEVLQRLAQILASNVRESDVVCRIGGEEFLIVLPNAPLELAMKRAEQLRSLIEQTVVETTHSCLRFTISLGITLYQHDESFDATLKRADDALYTAKHMGRNCVIALE